MVAPFLKIQPISEAVSKKRMIFSSSNPSQNAIKYCNTAGIPTIDYDDMQYWLGYAEQVGTFCQ